MTGTATQVGLDMMTSPELVAMISVDEKDATMRRWQLPAPGLLAALTRKTQGRVIRADTGVPIIKGEASELSDAEWQEFQDHTLDRVMKLNLGDVMEIGARCQYPPRQRDEYDPIDRPPGHCVAHSSAA